MSFSIVSPVAMARPRFAAAKIPQQRRGESTEQWLLRSDITPIQLKTNRLIATAGGLGLIAATQRFVEIATEVVGDPMSQFLLGSLAFMTGATAFFAGHGAKSCHHLIRRVERENEKKQG